MSGVGPVAVDFCQGSGVSWDQKVGIMGVCAAIII